MRCSSLGVSETSDNRACRADSFPTSSSIVDALPFRDKGIPPISLRESRVHPYECLSLDLNTRSRGGAIGIGVTIVALVVDRQPYSSCFLCLACVFQLAILTSLVEIGMILST